MAALAVIGYWFWRAKNPHQATVCAQQHYFTVEIADNMISQAQGLMNRASLDADKGMLFVFRTNGIHKFWMKNTLIPLDIVWLDDSQQVVFIEHNAKPCGTSECSAISPDKNSRYVLEINGGIAEKIGLHIGDAVTINE